MNKIANCLKIYHPFLFAIFPIIFLCSKNKEEILFYQTLVPVAIILSITVALLVIGSWIFKNYQKSAIITSIFLLIFFSYGRIYDIVSGWLGKKVNFSIQTLLLIILLIFFALAIYLVVKARKSVGNVTVFLNIVSIVLIIFSLSQIVIFKFKAKSFNSVTKSKEQTEANSAVAPNNLPDIYYIILDGYASNSTLKDIYNFDNQEFNNSLTNLGFYVGPENHSNYTLTFLTLASSLNMDYINDISDKIGADSKDRKILYQMISDNKVASHLKSKGYKFVHLSSGWGPTDTNSNADVNISKNYGNEFQMILIHTTMLRIFEGHWIFNGYLQKQRILSTFTELSKVNKMQEPTYTFAHIVCPHPPYIFTASGSLAIGTRFRMDGDIWLEKDNYLNQLKFINKKVATLVNKIISKSQIPPIIILQADHGSASTFYSAGDNKDRWNNPDNTNIKERMGIMTAYYLPGDIKKQLSGSITPVNTFRFIFKYYFNEDYNLLDDKSYFSSADFPYKYIDATEIIRKE